MKIKEDWADRRAEHVLKKLKAAKTDEKKLKLLSDDFRDLEIGCEPRHPLDM